MNRFIFAGLFSLFFSVHAHAAGSGVALRFGGMYWTHQFKNGATTTTTTTVTHYDFIGGLGYKMDSGLYLGGTYTWLHEEQRVESNSTIETLEDNTGYGPTIGYIGENFYFLGTYLIEPTDVTGSPTSKVTYMGGNGYQFDLGYMFWINSQFGMGPQFTYYHAEFKKIKGSSGTETDLASTGSTTDLRPILAFAVMF